MRIFWKAAIAAMALGAAAATPVAAQQYGDQYGQQYGSGIGPDGGVSFSYDSGGYCDDWGCPDDFWDMPVYYGSVFYDDQWFDGPVYYRDWYGQRQYWIHGNWRYDQWRGPRPGWWHEGRYGSALGMDYYRQHNFHGRWDNDRGYDQRHNFAPNDRSTNHGPDFGPQGGGNYRDERGFDRRAGFNGQNRPQGGPQGGQGRNNFQQNAAPQPNNSPRGNFDPRQGRPQQGGGAPAAAAPAPAGQPPAQGGGRHGHGDHHDNH